MGAQVVVEGLGAAAAEHDQALEVGAGEQGVLVTGEVEVLQAQPGQPPVVAEHGLQGRQALDLAHEPEPTAGECGSGCPGDRLRTRRGEAGRVSGR